MLVKDRVELNVNLKRRPARIISDTPHFCIFGSSQKVLYGNAARSGVCRFQMRGYND
jgi:hypothetical protein